MQRQFRIRKPIFLVRELNGSPPILDVVEGLNCLDEAFDAFSNPSNNGVMMHFVSNDENHDTLWFFNPESHPRWWSGPVEQ